MKKLINLLRHREMDKIDVNGGARLEEHRKKLMSKPMLGEVFVHFHDQFRKLDHQFFNGAGLELELGSGIAPMRDSYASVLATDIMKAPHLDRVLNAEAMELEGGSVRVFYAQNCFHHFSKPRLFFDELERTLAPGGGVILLEPYYGVFASFLYKRLFKTEGFDKTYPSWETPATGPMHGANQALSYIIFMRDRAEFEQKYPSLRIVHHRLDRYYLKYIFSGGLNFKQICPDKLSPVLALLQICLRPLNRWLALHHVIVLQKIKT